MNEKLQYASMLEMPVSTCTVTTKPAKKRRLKRKNQLNSELIKEQLLEKINSDTERLEQNQVPLVLSSELESLDVVDSADSQANEQTRLNQNQDFQTVSFNKSASKKRKGFKFSVIGAQFVVIGALVLTILLTNAIVPNSGINVFLNNVFSAEKVELSDQRVYSDFAPVIAMGNNQGITLSNGVINYGGEGSVYSACDGVVSSIVKDEQGKYTIEITHSQNFKSVINGVEYSYVGEGDKVYSNLPVGYLFNDGATMCFTNGQGIVISDYQIINNAVVWAV